MAGSKLCRGEELRPYTDGRPPFKFDGERSANHTNFPLHNWTGRNILPARVRQLYGEGLPVTNGVGESGDQGLSKDSSGVRCKSRRVVRTGLSLATRFLVLPSSRCREVRRGV